MSQLYQSLQIFCKTEVRQNYFQSAKIDRMTPREKTLHKLTPGFFTVVSRSRQIRFSPLVLLVRAVLENM